LKKIKFTYLGAEILEVFELWNFWSEHTREQYPHAHFPFERNPMRTLHDINEYGDYLKSALYLSLGIKRPPDASYWSYSMVKQSYSYTIFININLMKMTFLS